MDRLLDGLITWSIHHRIVVLIGAFALLVLGVWSATRAKLDVLPDFMPSRVVVQTEAPGMGTADVEELVTRPLERTLLGTPNTMSVRSASSPGLSVITLLFEDGIDIYRARQLVAERMELARGRLPSTVKARLAPIAAPIGALLRFFITSSDSDAERALRELRTFADWILTPRLVAIQGVAQVVSLGGDVERIEVRPDPERMRARGATLADVRDAIRGSQAIAGAGFVETANARIDVQNEARLTIASAKEDLEQLVVATRAEAPVRLADVADVVHAVEPRVGVAFYDGRPAVFVQVTKFPWADTLAVTNQVETALHELARDLPAGAHVEAPVFRQASFVRASIVSVGRAMAIGSGLVILILIAFLRSGRLAVISLTAIPLSLVAALAVLVSSGASINGMTLGGLAIAVGEVVDDAIVDVENVWRRLRENARLPDPRPALDVVHDASKEIRGSVVYATIIVVLVLVPILLLGGISGRIFSPLAQSYMLAIAASLLVALTVTPALCALLLPRLATPDSRPTKFAEWLSARYRRLLERVVARPRLTLLLAMLCALGAIVAVPFIGGRFLPEFHEGSLIAHVHAVPGTSLEETSRLAARVDAQMRPDLAVHTASRAGRAELDEDAAPVDRIELDVVMKPDDSRDWDEIVVDTAARIGRVPGLGFTVEGFLGERIHEVLSGETSPVVIRVLGSDMGVLRALAADVTRIVSSTSGFGSVRVEPQIDVPQLRIAPDRAALSRLGIRPQELAADVIAWRQGEALTQILSPNGRVVDVAIAGPIALRDEQSLSSLPISSRIMQGVPLAAAATIETVPTPAVVNHDGGERRISIGADVRGGGLSGAVRSLESRLTNGIKLPRGYRIEVSGEAAARSEAAVRLLLTGLLVLIGIFVLLSVAFGSLRDAGIVLFNFPLGLLGGVLAAVLSPEGLSVAGLVGFVTLFGIIARNGIMLVAHKRRLDETEPQMDPIRRVLQAAEDRLLPILMTAAAAGLGLLPLALSLGSTGSELESPMAVIVCAGLATSTSLNMLVLPTFYVWRLRRAEARKVMP